MPETSVNWQAKVEVRSPDGTTRYVETNITTGSRLLAAARARVTAELEMEGYEVLSILDAEPTVEVTG